MAHTLRTQATLADPIFEGNCKRIREFSDLGLREDAIVQNFRKKDIDISVNMVRAVLNGDLSKMRKKAFPKSEVEKISREINEIIESI